MIQLTDYGYSEKYHLTDNSLLPARITEIQRGLYKVISQEGEIAATLKGTLLRDMEETGDSPAVGDFVGLQLHSGGGVIHEILPRQSKFSRPDYSGHAAGYVKTILEQVVAANFDYVFILCSLNQDFNPARIQRYLAAAWQSGGIPVLVLTKTDLSPDYSAQLLQVQNAAPAVDIVSVSAKTGAGLEQLSPYLGSGKTIVFLGSSGVGKSSLVNALADKPLMKVNEIREDDAKGRHTTTHRQLLRLPNGTLVIDTPGMRELSLWDAGDGLGELFSDVEDLFSNCKFSNCGHNSEPGCGVKAALEAGTLTQTRWKAYLKLQAEAAFTDNKAAYLRAQANIHKHHTKQYREKKKRR